MDPTHMAEKLSDDFATWIVLWLKLEPEKHEPNNPLKKGWPKLIYVIEWNTTM